MIQRHPCISFSQICTEDQRTEIELWGLKGAQLMSQKYTLFFFGHLLFLALYAIPCHGPLALQQKATLALAKRGIRASSSGL